MRRHNFLVFFLFGLLLSGGACARAQSPPMLGAEVYIEPGQRPEQIDGWMRILGEHGMPLARVFMLWNYLEREPGKWDFSLWDSAFAAAQRHGVKITATLVPNSPPFFWGREYFYRVHVGDMFETREKRDRSADYVRRVVERYRNHPALDSWWLFNEPGQYPTPDSLAVEGFRGWLSNKYGSVDSLNKEWLTAYSDFSSISYDEAWSRANWVWPQSFLDWNRFWRMHIDSQLNWLSDEVRRRDTVHGLHTNPKNLIDLLAHYDLAGMRAALTAMGASMHPAWDFSKLTRDRFGMGIAWNNDLIRGEAGKLPYWVSELQGGNNIYSGFRPLCPTPDDIGQWVWTSLGAGAQRVIFWCLNGRLRGSEAGEWSLLDMDGRPSGRLEAAFSIARTLSAHLGVFAMARPVVSPVTVLVSKESLLIQERKQNNHPGIEGFKDGLHMKSSLACYMALLQRGLPVEVQEIGNYRWGQAMGKVVIVADAMALSQADMRHLGGFVSGGGKLVMLGLTGLFDEDERLWSALGEWPLAGAMGGTYGDIRLMASYFTLRLKELRVLLPAHLWISTVTPKNGRVVGLLGKEPVALRNHFGRGESVWVTPGVAMGGWLNGLEPFSEMLAAECMKAIKQTPFQFRRYYADCWMRVMETPGQYITILCNGDSVSHSVMLKTPPSKISMCWYGRGWNGKDNKASLAPGATVVVAWKK